VIKVLIYHSPSPRLVLEEELELPPGSILKDALQALKVLDSSLFWDPESKHGELDTLKGGFASSIWSKPAPLNQSLRDQDRIEIVRPIKVDPKVARRERFKKQGTKGAGLFAKQRPGAKAGY
jgi:putative ubiquitin-RnfH superfamily antitoxin RatB of RatAB toxin-antitoxin module